MRLVAVVALLLTACAPAEEWAPDEAWLAAACDGWKRVSLDAVCTCRCGYTHPDSVGGRWCQHVTGGAYCECAAPADDLASLCIVRYWPPE